MSNQRTVPRSRLSMDCLDVTRMMTVAVSQRKAARGLPEPGG
jgi:hypothetical protein